MFYLTIVVFVGVIIIAFPKELMGAIKGLVKNDLRRNALCLIIFTFSVYTHMTLIGEILNKSAHTSNLITSSLFPFLTFGSIASLVLHSALLLIMSLLVTTTISFAKSVLVKKCYHFIYELFWLLFSITLIPSAYFM